MIIEVARGTRTIAGAQTPGPVLLLLRGDNQLILVDTKGRRFDRLGPPLEDLPRQGKRMSVPAAASRRTVTALYFRSPRGAHQAALPPPRRLAIAQ